MDVTPGLYLARKKYKLINTDHVLRPPNHAFPDKSIALNLSILQKRMGSRRELWFSFSIHRDTGKRKAAGTQPFTFLGPCYYSGREE